MRSLCHVDEEKCELVNDIHHLVSLGVYLTDSENGDVFVHQVL